MNKQKLKNIIKKLFRFYIVSGIVVSINFVIMYIMTDRYNINYLITLGVICLFNVFVFFAQKYFTFRNNDKNIKKQSIMFFIRLGMLFLPHIFLIPTITKYTGNNTISMMIIVVISSIINYLVQDFIIFKKQKQTT